MIRVVKHRRGRGFTLLELVIVMIIIFVVAGVVAPRFSDFVPSMRIQKAGDRLFAWAQKARADAATTGLRHRVVVDPAGKRFWIDYEARPFRDPGKFTPLADAWEDAIPDEVSVDRLDGFDPDPDNAELRVLEFRPDGTTADATIAVSDDRGNRASIKIVGATGRVAFETADDNGK